MVHDFKAHLAEKDDLDHLFSPVHYQPSTDESFEKLEVETFVTKTANTMKLRDDVGIQIPAGTIMQRYKIGKIVGDV